MSGPARLFAIDVSSLFGGRAVWNSKHCLQGPALTFCYDRQWCKSNRNEHRMCFLHQVNRHELPSVCKACSPESQFWVIHHPPTLSFFVVFPPPSGSLGSFKEFVVSFLRLFPLTFVTTRALRLFLVSQLFSHTGGILFTWQGIWIVVLFKAQYNEGWLP